MVSYFQPAQEVIVRYRSPLEGFERGSIARVVEDSSRRTLIYVSAGSGYSQLDWVGSDNFEEYSPDDFIDRTWNSYSMLRIMYPDVPYSIWVMWAADSGDFRRWYVNIEEPFVRTTIGFDTIDFELDIVVAPDLTWEWKDEDRLAMHVENGVFTKDQALDFREYGLHALKRLEQRQEPFNEPWPNWKPDPSWGPLKMPANRSDWLEIGHR